MINCRRTPQNRGFTLLFAVLVASIILTIALGIHAIALRTISISSGEKESNRASNMATQGFECAMYWDRGWPEPNGLQYSPFASSTEGYNNPPRNLSPIANPTNHANVGISTPTNPSSGGTVVALCGPTQNIFDSSTPTAGGPGSSFRITTSAGSAVSTFQLQYYVGGQCIQSASTTVEKFSGTSPHTVITSDGFSDCIGGNPRRINRTFYVDVQGEGISNGGAGGPAPSGPPPASPPPSYLKVLSSGQCLRPESLPIVNGTHIVQGACDSGALSFAELAMGSGLQFRTTVSGANWYIDISSAQFPPDGGFYQLYGASGSDQETTPTSYSPYRSFRSVKSGGCWDVSADTYLRNRACVAGGTATQKFIVDTGSGGNQSPTASITSPPNGSVIAAGNSVAINAVASDPDAGDSISKVEFYRDGTTLLCPADTTAPYSCNWTNVPAGSYTLTAKAYDQTTGTYVSSGVGITVQGLVGLWTFDSADTSVTTANDTSGLGNNGTITNGPIASVAGKIAQALSFDKVNDYVNMFSPAVYDNMAQKTLCAWIRPGSYGQSNGANYGEIVSKIDASNGWAVEVSNWNGYNSLLYWHGFTGANGYWHAPVNAIPLNSWSHVCVTYDKSSTANMPAMYINGSPVAVTANSGAPSGISYDENSADLQVGNCCGTTQTFDGPIDDVRVYNKILTPGEVSALYAAGAGGAPPLPPAVTPLTNGVQSTPFDDPTRNQYFYSIAIPAGSGVVVDVAGTGPDVDAYVSYGCKPHTDDGSPGTPPATCAPLPSAADVLIHRSGPETYGFIAPTTGTYYITLDTYSGPLTNVSLKVTYGPPIGETNILASDDSGNANYLVAQQATLGQASTLRALSFYVGAASGNLRLGVYDNTGAGGSPGTLKAQSNSFVPVAGWNTVNVTSPIALPAGTYWLTYLTDDNILGYKRDSTSGLRFKIAYPFGAMPATFPAGASSVVAHWSFYGDLTVP